MAEIVKLCLMSQQQDQSAPQDGSPSEAPVVQQQQQPQPGNDGHGGQGSESAMKHLREWEQRRASHSGKRRQGPN